MENNDTNQDVVLYPSHVTFKRERRHPLHKIHHALLKEAHVALTGLTKAMLDDKDAKTRLAALKLYFETLTNVTTTMDADEIQRKVAEAAHGVKSLTCDSEDGRATTDFDTVQEVD